MLPPSSLRNAAVIVIAKCCRHRHCEMLPPSSLRNAAAIVIASLRSKRGNPFLIKQTAMPPAVTRSNDSDALDC